MRYGEIPSQEGGQPQDGQSQLGLHVDIRVAVQLRHGGQESLYNEGFHGLVTTTLTHPLHVGGNLGGRGVGVAVHLIDRGATGEGLAVEETAGEALDLTGGGGANLGYLVRQEGEKDVLEKKEGRGLQFTLSGPTTVIDTDPFHHQSSRGWRYSCVSSLETFTIVRR